MKNSDPQTAQWPDAETIGELFINSRGETINAKVELFTDPVRGEAWQAWAAQHLPVGVFEAFGMLNTEGSEGWLNVVEHCTFVAAGALVVGHQMAERGVEVNFSTLVRAAIVHDASKRMDVEQRTTREAEAVDQNLDRVLNDFGYTPEEIAAAKNTGRQADRYIQDPDERMAAIESHSVEANIIGYVDARTRGSRSATLDSAMNDSVASKPGSAEFFTDSWRPYYGAVEDYFAAIAPGFDPAQLNGEIIFAEIQQ